MNSSSRRLLGRGRGIRRVLYSAAACLMVGLQFAGSPPAHASDGPSGFVYGTDSNGPAPFTSGSGYCPSKPPAPWTEPDVKGAQGCGSFGAYMGEVGGYYRTRGCTGSNVFNATAAADASTNLALLPGDDGFMPYFQLGGPGMDPKYNGTTAEATAWGKQQAATAVSEANAEIGKYVGAQILWADIEAQVASGWNAEEKNSNCTQSGSASIPSNVDMAVINGFDSGVLASGYWDPGIYTSPGIYQSVFGAGYNLPNVMIWTAEWGSNTNCPNPAPIGWTQPSDSCNSSRSPTFFGQYGSGSNCAVAWQWDSYKGSADFNQFDSNRLYACIPA